MDLTLTRFAKRTDGIFSRLLSDAGVQLAVTLEHAYGDPESGWTPKLPAGTYTCKRGDHLLTGMLTPFETFEITSVPGHTGILFHWGNWNADSDGCVLLGAAFADSPEGLMITNSKMSFGQFLALQHGLSRFTLTVN